MVLVAVVAELVHSLLGLVVTEQMVQHMVLVAAVADRPLVLATEATEAMAHPEQ
jgi:hypothetical protein